MKKIALLISLIIYISTGSSCSKEIELEKFSVSRPMLGTIINMTLYCEKDKVVQAVNAAYNEIKRIEKEMSPYIKESDISRINAGAGTFVEVSSENIELINQSLEISKESDGTFDISFASIAHLWNYKSKQFIPPKEREVESFKKYVNYRNIEIAENSVKLKYPKMKIGLGGIAKGYAIRRAVEVLQENGVATGIVEAGGDLQVFGKKQTNQPWRTGVMHPRKKSIIMIIDLDEMDSIATSGDYERVVMYKGKRYHHIIDPRTGYPADTFASVSVITRDPVLSDAYATALFVMGLEKAKVFLAEHKNVTAIFIDMDMNIYAPCSLQSRINMVKHIEINWF